MDNFLKFISILSVVFFVVSCSTKKPIAKATGATEINLPFSEKKYKTDKDAFRAVQSGTSSDLPTAKKVAMINAQTTLAANIQSIVKTVTDNYTNQRTVKDKQEFQNKFEEISRNVAKQKLSDVKIIGEKAFQEQNDKYIFWIAIEMDKDELLDNLSNQISRNKGLQLDFEKQQFEKILDKEMEQFENQ